MNPADIRQVDLVHWIDSCGTDQMWVDLDDLPDRCPRFWTCGFVVREDDESLTIAATVGDNNQIGELVTIPKVALLRRVTVLAKGVATCPEAKEAAADPRRSTRGSAVTTAPSPTGTGARKRSSRTERSSR